MYSTAVFTSETSCGQTVSPPHVQAPPQPRVTTIRVSKEAMSIESIKPGPIGTAGEPENTDHTESLAVPTGGRA